MPTQLTFFTVTGDWRNITDPLLQGTTNTASVEIVSALVDFRPRVPDGFVTYVNDYELTVDTNEIQLLTMQGVASGGTFTLNYAGEWTTAIAYNASAATVRGALEGLSGIGAGNVTVTGSAGGPWTVTFVNALGNQPVTQIIANEADLDGSGPPNINIDTIIDGAEASSRDTAIALPVRHARVWEGRLATINVSDTLDVKLLANSPALDLPSQGISQLIYDVEFSKVTFAEEDRQIKPFAFAAPATATSVSLSDPNLVRLPYNPYR